MIELLVEILSFFNLVYEADERPEARQITVGCGVVAVTALLLFAIWVAFRH